MFNLTGFPTLFDKSNDSEIRLSDLKWEYKNSTMESLILAQDERWRRA